MRRWREIAVILAVCAGAGRPALAQPAGDRPADETPAQRGFRLLTTKAYLPPDFDREVFDRLWERWEEPARSQAAAASPEKRRKLAFARYGLTEAPDRPGQPLQYVVDGQGGWHMNCFACHGGQAAGQTWPGAPNSRFAMQTLTEEVRATKLLLGKKLAHLDLGSLAMPLGTTNGTTNSVMFGVALLSHRDPELNVRRYYTRPKLLHHDHDAPPWWNVKYKQRLYSDGFASKGHRPLMQFLLVPSNGPEKFREWEADYADVLAYIESVEAPKYPRDIDRDLAARGEKAFNANCARCHGAYGAEPSYPESVVAIEELGVDRARLDSMTAESRAHYGQTWFTNFRSETVTVEPKGYVAPPLHGIWASAPYLHNGSIPTLWRLLHPERRPVVWRRSGDRFDWNEIGPQIEALDDVPAVASSAERRQYFDTREFGKSAQGHDFPAALSAEEKSAVLEYLKTL